MDTYHISRFFFVFFFGLSKNKLNTKVQYRSLRFSWTGQHVEGYEGYHTIFYTVFSFYSDLETDHEEVGMEDNDGGFEEEY